MYVVVEKKNMNLKFHIPGNLELSTNRAKAVYDQLVKNVCLIKDMALPAP